MLQAGLFLMGIGAAMYLAGKIGESLDNMCAGCPVCAGREDIDGHVYTDEEREAKLIPANHVAPGGDH